MARFSAGSVVLALMAFVLWCASGSGASAVPGASAANDKTPVLVNLTSGKANLHSVSMGLSLAHSCAAEGHPVLVFLNVEASIFAARDLGEDVKFGDFPPVKKMLADVIAAGGKVVACDHCSHLMKIEQSEMIPGVTVGAHKDLLRLIRPGTVGFSY